MVVASLKGCWSKFSARIRDYYWDTIDYYYCKASPADHSSHPNTCSSSSCLEQSSKAKQRHKSNHHRHYHHNCDQRSCAKDRSNKSCSSSAAASSAHQQSRLANCNSQPQATTTAVQALPNLDQQEPSALLKKPTNIPVSKRVLPKGFSKRITSQGQVFFCDQNGKKYWYDPSVSKELISASLDLDSIIGELSSNWEIRRTASGKTYYVNHIKKTTQFTDPRLVAYKEYIFRYVHKQRYSRLHKQAVTYSRQLRKNQIPMLDSGPVPNPQALIAKYSGNCVPPIGKPFRSGSRYRDDVDNISARHRCSAPDPCPNFEPFADRLLEQRRLATSRAIGHQSNFHANLLTSSHHDLSAATNDTTATNHSNTLTGIPPTWFKPRSIAEVNKQQRAPPQNNQASISNSLATPLTPSSSEQQQQNVYNNINLSPYSANTMSPLSGTYQQHNSSYRARNQKELFDKISILRQELLKQQIVGHPCRIDISRKKIFEDSFKVIHQMHSIDLKKRLLIKFKGEEGLDYGGVAREWFFLLSREMLNPIHGLFQYTSDDIYNLQINPDSGIVYREHLSYLHFCGRLIGMAVFHGHFIEGHFTLPFYKMLLRKPITLADIELVDPDLHRSLCWILENDITNVIDTTFLVQHNALGQLQEHELKEGGKNIVVTEENKHEYVSLYVNYRCRRGIEHQFDELQRGFYELVPPSLIDNFDEYELELLIGGLSKINIDDWRVHTKLKNCTVETPLVKWFWDIVRSYGEDKRARLLQFVTGSPRVPIQGFKALQGVNSELRLFTIHLIKNASTDNLPKSHTCFNRIDLPPYESYEKLRDKLTQAIEETMGFAMQ